MRTFKYNLIITVSLLFSLQIAKTQNSGDDVVFKAMSDEMNRSTNSLKINEYKPPFFIAYRLIDGKSLNIKASLGAISESDENPIKSHTIRLMVGDYSLNDENFVSRNRRSSSGGYISLPVDKDYNAIRRSFWIMTDGVYKSALENYEQKLTALKQQNKEESEQLDDYSKITPITYIQKDISVTYDKVKWENATRDLSAVFKNYKDISASSVVLSCTAGSYYYYTNEGTKLKIPGTFASLAVNAVAQAEDGEQLKDQLLYYAPLPEQLPSADKIKQDIIKMAENLTTLIKAPIMQEGFSGPVIFEGEALGEIISSKFFNRSGLIASREPVYAVEQQNQGSINKLDNKINQRVCSSKITIKATPKLKSFGEVPLIGSFEVDAEGVVPPEELILVENGKLKTLLNDRIPTPKVKESNGHNRFSLNGGSQTGPGVIQISYKNGTTLDSLKIKALQEAKENELDYIYIIRKLEIQNMGTIQTNIAGRRSQRAMPVSKPIGIYQVSVKTGEEKLLRSAIVSDLELNDFKYISQGTKEQFVYNTLWGNIPVSYIIPKAIIFSDISLEKDKTVKPKLPVVENPLMVLK